MLCPHSFCSILFFSLTNEIFCVKTLKLNISWWKFLKLNISLFDALLFNKVNWRMFASKNIFYKYSLKLSQKALRSCITIWYSFLKGYNQSYVCLTFHFIYSLSQLILLLYHLLCWQKLLHRLYVCDHLNRFGVFKIKILTYRQVFILFPLGKFSLEKKKKVWTFTLLVQTPPP